MNARALVLAGALTLFVAGAAVGSIAWADGFGFRDDGDAGVALAQSQDTVVEDRTSAAEGSVAAPADSHMSLATQEPEDYEYDDGEEEDDWWEFWDDDDGHDHEDDDRGERDDD